MEKNLKKKRLIRCYEGWYWLCLKTSKNYKGTEKAEVAENKTPFLGDSFFFTKRYMAIDIDVYGLLALRNFFTVI